MLDDKVTVTAVVVTANVHKTFVPLRRQGELRMKSVVRLMERAFDVIAEEVRIFMAS